MDILRNDSLVRMNLWGTAKHEKLSADNFNEKLKRLDAFKFVYRGEDSTKNKKFDNKFNDECMSFSKMRINNPEESEEEGMSLTNYTKAFAYNKEIDEKKSQPKKLILNAQIYSKLSYKDNFQYCLCNLTKSEKPTRNLLFSNIDSNHLDAFLEKLKKFGDIQNIDLCNLEKDGILIVTFYDILAATNAFSNLANNLEKAMNNTKKIEISYLIPFNDIAFLDFMLLLNRSCFDEELTVFFFSQFGKVMNIYPSDNKYVIKFTDIRTLDQIRKFINLAEENIDRLGSHHIFFLLNILLFNKDNITNIFLKYANEKALATTTTIIPSLLSKQQHHHNQQLHQYQQQQQQNVDLPKFKKPLRINSKAFEQHKIKYNNTLTQFPEKKPIIMPSVLGLGYDNKHENNENDHEDILMKKSQEIDLRKIFENMDKRTTLMVRNIPNRYTQYNLIDIININYRGLYDFVYMPIDANNKCNIGYAFINFIDCKHIINFYNEFFGKRWELYRSEKICHLNYGKFQGKNELINHFYSYNMKNHSHKPLILPNPLHEIPI